MMKSKILIYIFLSTLFINLALAKEYESSIAVVPSQLTVQSCGIATYDINIKNLGEKEDTLYALVEGIPEGWYVLSHESVTLKSGESKNVYLFITADCYSEPKNYSGKISYLGKTESSASFGMNVIADHSLKIEAPSLVSSCLCEESSIFVTIENTGKYDEDAVLSVNGATLKENKIKLKAGEKKQVELLLDKACEAQVGVYDIELKAESTSSYARTSAKFGIRRNKCYDFETLYVKEFTTCVNEPITFIVSVKNTGTKEDTFQVNIEALNFNKIVSIKPGETKNFEASFRSGEYGTIDLGFSVKSSSKSMQGTIRFNIEKCYGVDIQPEENKLEIKSGSGKLLKAKLINTGIMQDTYTISSDVGWVSIRPLKVTLIGNGSDDIFIYYSPEFGALGKYETKLKAESERASDEETITINVFKELIEQPPVEPIEINITTTQEQAPTGKGVAVTLQDWLKNKIFVAVAAGVIVTLIIFGLIYLFVMRD